MRKIIILFSILLFTGCATTLRLYEDDSVKKENIAIIEAYSRIGKGWSADRQVFISHINNKNIKWLGICTPFNRVIEVLPGKKDIRLNYTSALGYANSKVWFIAEEGKRYRPFADVSGYNVHFYIEEVDTGKKVGGIKGSSDEPEK